MKKTIVLSILLCLLLSGCGSKDLPDTDPQGSDTDGTQPPQEEQSTPPIEDFTDESTVRLAYYEQLVTQLQQELLEMKTALYVSRVEYEGRIAELEAKIEDASAQEDPSQAHFSYEIENGGAKVTAYSGEAREVTVPSTLGGYPVSAIGDRAFMDHAKLTCVILPDSVKSIGWFAFSGCVSLERVTLTSSVEAISYGAFQNCPSRMAFVCPADSYAAAFAKSYGIAVRQE